MSICRIKLKFKKHLFLANENTDFKYRDSIVECKFNFEDDFQLLEVVIIADSSQDNLYIGINILEYLFLALGRIPEIDSFKIDGISQIKKISDIYFCSRRYNYRDMALFCINKGTLNAEILYETTKMNNKFPLLSSFIALHSHAYEKICEEHRINLLIHSLEGYHRIKNPNKMNLIERLDDCLNDLDYYDKKYEIGINEIYDNKINEVFKNIRNQYSHYFDANISKLTGLDYFVGFYIISYSFRLKIIKDIGIVVNENYIIEYYISLYKWIQKEKRAK